MYSVASVAFSLFSLLLLPDFAHFLLNGPPVAGPFPYRLVLPPRYPFPSILSPLERVPAPLHICTMPPRSSLTSSFSVTDANNEVVCPLKNNDGSNCRKRCLGVSTSLYPSGSSIVSRMRPSPARSSTGIDRI